MPTGYTADVQNGKITDFRDFALKCSRAFGALVMMRDDSMGAAIPERFEPETKYYDDAIAGAKKSLAQLRGMSTADATKAALDEHVEAMAGWSRRQNEKRLQRQRYTAMLDKAKVWQPPSDDHAELKKFMIDQLRESINFDTSSSRFDEAPVTPSGDRWLVEKIAEAEATLKRNVERRAEEIERTEKRNRWLADLRASLAEAA